MTLSVLKRIPSSRGFGIYPIHFTMDPEKAPDAWEVEQRPQFPSQDAWNREMEIDFSSQVGKRAYTSFNKNVHVRATNAEAHPNLPLCLELDFNVDPLVWNITQQWGQVLVAIDEIRLAPATIEGAVIEFRNMYPAHPAGIEFYGDGMGHNRDVQTARSNYDLVTAAMRGYPTPVSWFVPKNNPLERDRVNSLNRKLVGIDGKAGIAISPRCKELIADFDEVVWKEDGSKLLKIYAQADPYHERTHASDAIGYHVWRVWPTITESSRSKRQEVRAPLRYGSVLGTTDGVKARR